MLHFIINVILFVVSCVATWRFSTAILAEKEMGYKAPPLEKFGLASLLWFSQFCTAGILIMLTDPLIRPFWYYCPYSWLGTTLFVSLICVSPTFIPEPKKDNKISENRVIGVTAPASCPPNEHIFWNRDLGLYILETIQSMSDEAVRRLYYSSKEKMYALDDAGRDWSYMLHVNSIAFVVAMDRHLQLNI